MTGELIPVTTTPAFLIIVSPPDGVRCSRIEFAGISDPIQIKFPL